jgi:CxxC-x17-CxxC domain-containing protein
VGAADAAAFEEEFAPVFVPEDLVNLANHNIYLKLMIDGAASQPFSATTLPPIGTPTGSRDKVIAVSRERYASKREVIEEKIERWWGFGEAENAPTSEERTDRGAYQRSSSPVSFPRRRESSFSDSPPASPASFPRRRESSFSDSPPFQGGVRGGGSYDDNRPTYPAVCSRCGKNTTAKFNPDPNKPFYCEDCLPIMREKIRLQSSPPPPLEKEGRGGFSSPPLKVRGGRGSYDSDSRPTTPKRAATPPNDAVSPGLSLSALTPRPPKPSPLEKGDRGGFSESSIINQKSEIPQDPSRPSPPKVPSRAEGSKIRSDRTS